MAPQRKGDLRRSRPLTAHFTESEMEGLRAAALEADKPVARLVHDVVRAMLWDRTQQALALSLEKDDASEASWRQTMGLT